MRDVLAVWRNTRSIVLVALSAGLYAAVLIPFKAIPVVPGVTEIRPANAIPPVMSLLFGPPAAWGCAIGNLIGDFFGSIGPGSVFGFVGNFLLGYLPYRLWQAFAPRRRARGALVQLPLFVLVTIAASAACSLVIGFGVDWLGAAPYVFLFPFITLNNAAMGVVIGPILLALLYPRAARWGLLAEEVHDERDLRNGLLAPVAGLVVLAACVGGWVLVKDPALLGRWVSEIAAEQGQLPPPFAWTPIRVGSGALSLLLLAATALLARGPRFERKPQAEMRAPLVTATSPLAPLPSQGGRPAASPLVVDGVSFRYRGDAKRALDSVSLRLEPGAFVALMGATGAGKSTLCRCANGLIPQFVAGEFAGSTAAFGVPVSSTPVREHAGLVGLVFQDFDAQLVSSDVSLEIAFAMENLGVPRPEMQARVTQALKQVGLEGFERRDPETLSGGEKQRLAIASVLAARPRLLVLDEPTTDLDPQGKQAVFETARLLAREGLTVLMAEHEPDHALAADRVVALDQGHIAYDGPGRGLLTDPQRCLELGIRPPELPACFAAIGADERPVTLEEAVEAGRRLGLQLDHEALARINEVPPVGEPIIEVQDLRYRYAPGVEAVAGVSLTIRQGEFLALLGQNGSGKTTLAKHLNGLLKPTAGSVSRSSGLQTRPGAVGYVFQNPDHQIFCATVRDEVGFGPQTLGLDRRLVDEALEATGLTDLAEADPFALTKGERQAVAVASALACDPQVLVLDEPTTGLDGPQQERMLNLLRDLNSRGRTIIIITHSMWAAATYARRVVVMAHGRLLADGPTREVFGNAEALAEAHLRPTATAELSRALFGVTLLSPEEFGRVARRGVP